jgi:hypothetical protein
MAKPMAVRTRVLTGAILLAERQVRKSHPTDR